MSVLKRQVHVLSGGGQRRWDGMIRQEVCAQVTSSRTSWRRAKTMGWNDQTRCLRSSDKFTYFLEEGKDDGMGWSDKRSALKPQVHVLSGGGQRRGDGLIRQEVCAQATSSRTAWRRAKTMGWDDQTRVLHASDKFTYYLQEGHDDRTG